MSGSSITFSRNATFVALAVIAFWFSFLLIDVVCRASDSCAEAASCGTCCLHAHPELWVVNTRCAPPCGDLDAGFERITYERWDADRHTFVRESREAFLASESDRPTLLFSHGNTLTHEKAMETACWPIYHRLRVCAGPKRMVFWTWPAEVLYKRPLMLPFRLTKKNLKAKYEYSENQGYYIAKFVNMMSFAHPITLSGHSYGGVTIVSALHYLGGGQLNGRVLDGGAPVERVNLRAAIVSGAFDDDAVYPGRMYGQALAPVELFYTTFNPRDSTLKMWEGFSPRERPAAGLTGICAACLGPYAHKLRQDQLTEDVKRSHYLKPHLASQRMVSAICSTAFPAGQSACGCSFCATHGHVAGNAAAMSENLVELPLSDQNGFDEDLDGFDERPSRPVSIIDESSPSDASLEVTFE